MADAKAITKAIETAHGPILEMLEDIKARLERLEVGKGTKTPSTNGGTGCQYTKKSGEKCGRKPRPDTEYCPEHPEGMTRAQLKKRDEGGSTSTGSSGKTEVLKMEPYEDNDDFELLTAPALVKNVLVSSSRPHRVYFKVNGDKFEPVEDDALINALKKLGLIMADEKESQETAEQLGGEISFAPKKPVKPLTKIAPRKKPASDDEDEPPKEAKVLTKLADKKKPVLKKKEEAKEDSEEDDDPKPSKKEEPKPTQTKKTIKKVEEVDDDDDVKTTKASGNEQESKPTKNGVTEEAKKAVSKVPVEESEKSPENKPKRVIPNLKEKAAKKPVSDDDEEEDE